MAKGRTKNTRARKPDNVSAPIKPIPAAPTGYFTIPVNRHGYVERNSLGTFYHPSEPVYHYKVSMHPEPTKTLEWTPSGWISDIPSDDLKYITPIIEGCFSPLRFRFFLNFD